jgi:hypothetical protein
MPDAFIVGSFVRLLQAFVPCFTAPSFPTFVRLMGGWSLATGRHTVTGVVRAANAVGWKHISTFHRFFSRGRWCTDRLGLILVRLVVERCLKPGDAIVAPVDDTLGLHTGKAIAGASMHRDPLLSTGRRPFFHWGHLWVVGEHRDPGVRQDVGVAGALPSPPWQEAVQGREADVSKVP